MSGGSPGTALLLLCLLALTVLLVPDSPASTARLRALGGEGAYLEDPANVLLWYGSLGDYPNLVIAETGAWEQNGGYRGEGAPRRAPDESRTQSRSG